MTKEKAKPLRRLKRFTPEQNERLNKLEIIEEETEIETTEQPSFGLGLKKRRIARSSNSLANQEREFTPGLPSRSPRIISQEALNAWTYGAMSNLPLYSPVRENIPPPLYDPIDLDHFCAPVTHPTTGKIISKRLNRDTVDTASVHV